MKKYKNTITAIVIAAAALVFVYRWGGNGTGMHGWTVEKRTPSQGITADEKTTAAKEIPKEKTKQNLYEDAATQQDSNEAAEQTVQDDKITAPKESENSAPSVKKSVQTPVNEDEFTCTLSIKCSTVLNNMNYLNPDKKGIIPANGIILAEHTAEFNDGESVFDVLLRETRNNKIHMEYSSTPVYSSTYIEGIANLYEFDCGELSGWQYKVNGKFPNCGCSRYKLKKGDKIEWVYTCDLGADTGGYNVIQR